MFSFRTSDGDPFFNPPNKKIHVRCFFSVLFCQLEVFHDISRAELDGPVRPAPLREIEGEVRVHSRSGSNNHSAVGTELCVRDERSGVEPWKVYTRVLESFADLFVLWYGVLR